MITDFLGIMAQWNEKSKNCTIINNSCLQCWRMLTNTSLNLATEGVSWSSLAGIPYKQFSKSLGDWKWVGSTFFPNNFFSLIYHIISKFWIWCVFHIHMRIDKLTDIFGILSSLHCDNHVTGLIQKENVSNCTFFLSWYKDAFI